MIQDIVLDYRDIKDQVYIVTGGFYSLGAEVVAHLAARGARLILLCEEPFDWQGALKCARGIFRNNNIWAVDCDLNCADCISAFVQEWLKPDKPRRLDGIICCASFPVSSLEAPSKVSFVNSNHLYQLYLLRELCPAFLLQPSDRQVRIVVVTHFIYRGDPWKNYPPTKEPPTKEPPTEEQEDESLLHRWVKAVFPIRSMSTNLYFQSQLLFGMSGQQIQSYLLGGLAAAPSNILIFSVNSGLARNRNAIKDLEQGNSNKYRACKYFYRHPHTKICSSGVRGVLHALFSPLSELKKMPSSIFYVNNTQISEDVASKYMKRYGISKVPFYDTLECELWQKLHQCKCSRRTTSDKTFRDIPDYSDEFSS